MKVLQLNGLPLEDLKISIKNNDDNIDYLYSLGYERRSGSVAYERNYITIEPFRKIFYQDNVKYS